MSEHQQTMSETDSSTANEPVLRLQGVSKYFGGLVAVDNVSFEIPHGEILGLIGPNGSGKSTLFKLIFGVHEVTDGTIEFNGEKISDGQGVNDIAEKGIAQFYQESTLMQDISVSGNIRLSVVPDSLLRFRGSHEYDDRIDEVLELTGLDEVVDTPAEDLTHKNKQKLELAKAIVRDPDLLLLDEPFAGLTKDEADEIIEIIRKLNEQGMTICIVDHNLRWLRSFVERIVVLHDGNLIADGVPEDIVEDKQVQSAYIGEQAMEESNE
jgi:branched-chain amino acid transport system ATP-binding protein